MSAHLLGSRRSMRRSAAVLRARGAMHRKCRRYPRRADRIGTFLMTMGDSPRRCE